MVLEPSKKAERVFSSKQLPKKLTYAQFYRYLLAILDTGRGEKGGPCFIFGSGVRKAGHRATATSSLCRYKLVSILLCLLLLIQEQWNWNCGESIGWAKQDFPC